MSMYQLELSGIDDIVNNLVSAEKNAGQEIDQYLRSKGAETIKNNIINIIPRSGRIWKGKKAAASSTQPFEQQNGTLSVTIKSKSAYNYLYFPDDGSNTKKHAGNQQFMYKGAENSMETIINDITDKLTAMLEGE